MYFRINGLAYGDTLSMPGSMRLDLSVPQHTVPEPASLLLFGTGLVGLRAWRRR